MKFILGTPAAAPVTYAQMASHLLLNDDEDRDDVLATIDAATSFAEQSMACSLVQRTITATFFENEILDLPRGPVSSVTSLTDLNGNHPTYRLERYGDTDVVIALASYKSPLVIVYVAGYGETAADVPAEIRQAIKMHAYTMYENRQSITDKSMVPVPQSLEDFYRLRSRRAGVA